MPSADLRSPWFWFRYSCAETHRYRERSRYTVLRTGFVDLFRLQKFIEHFTGRACVRNDLILLCNSFIRDVMIDARRSFSPYSLPDRQRRSGLSAHRIPGTGHILSLPIPVPLIDVLNKMKYFRYLLQINICLDLWVIFFQIQIHSMQEPAQSASRCQRAAMGTVVTPSKFQMQYCYHLPHPFPGSLYLPRSINLDMHLFNRLIQYKLNLRCVTKIQTFCQLAAYITFCCGKPAMVSSFLHRNPSALMYALQVFRSVAASTEVTDVII